MIERVMRDQAVATDCRHDTFRYAVIATNRNPSRELLETEVRISHHEKGHPQTSLTEPSVVVCHWVQEANIMRAMSRKGYCPALEFNEVLRAVAVAADYQKSDSGRAGDPRNSKHQRPPK